MAAVASIQVKEIREIKGYANPPTAVKDIFVLINYVAEDGTFKKNGKRVEPSWANCLNTMKNPKEIMAKLQAIDFSKVPDSKIKDI